MASKRFSPEELYELRNVIPIEDVMSKLLTIPSEIEEGIVRYLCPICHCYNTTVNPKINLARCFTCEKNFNTIDIVMITLNTDFVTSVKTLMKNKFNFCKNEKKKENHSNTGLEHITHVLQRMKNNLNNTHNYKDNGHEYIQKQMNELKDKINSLTFKIHTIEKSLLKK